MSTPTPTELEHARARLRAAGFTDADMATITGMGLRRIDDCPAEATVLVKVAAGALSVHGARQALSLADAKARADAEREAAGRDALARLIDDPGFFRLERGSRSTGLDTSETWWSVGCAPPRFTFKCMWASGPTASAAALAWLDMFGDTTP